MSEEQKGSGNVIVACRVRPLNNKEIALGSKCCLEFNPNKKGLTLSMSSESSSAFGTNKFAFDRVFDMDSE